jgi:C-terminal processing protease CtpA/Prc
VGPLNTCFRAGKLRSYSVLPNPRMQPTSASETAQLTAWKGTNLEGHGQQPTIEVPFSPEAARRGVDNQLDRALDVVAE